MTDMLKCRGLAIETRKWVYGYYCKIEGKHYIILKDAQISDVGPKGIEAAGFVEVVELTVRLLAQEKSEK